jgi:hypothetical protein
MKMTINPQVCPECGQLFEYGVWYWKTELCSLECRAEYAMEETERRREWQRDELSLQLQEIESEKRGKP